jgi:hypothetical protein
MSRNGLLGRVPSALAGNAFRTPTHSNARLGMSAMAGGNAFRQPAAPPRPIARSRPPVAPIGHRRATDGVYTYHFEVFPIGARPARFFSIYGFIRGGTDVLYWGQAISVAARMEGHDKLDRAKRLGADELWVCTPLAGDCLDYDTGEQRLIQSFCPVLNKQHNWQK